MKDDVMITQEDRDAAAVYGKAVGILTRGEAAAILNGHNDDCTIVQAFAHHRLAAEQRAREEAGWIIGNADGTLWRRWDAGGPEWTSQRSEAVRYARREDAEAVHAEDEDAWCVVPFAITNGDHHG